MSSSQSPPSLSRLVPVLSATASVTFGITEYWTLIPFLQPSIPPKSLSDFWNSYLYQTSPGWIGFGALSATTGFLGWKHSLGTAKSLYGWGAVFALGHYTFGPNVAKVIERIVYGPSTVAKDSLRYWLKLHTVRMIVADIPAMVCFMSAFLQLL